MPTFFSGAWGAMNRGPVSTTEEATEEVARPQESAWTFVLAVFGLSRLFFFGVGELAALLLPWATPADVVLEPGYLNHWAHWDPLGWGFVLEDRYRGL